MQSFPLHYLPIAFGLLMVTTFIITYSMSVASGFTSVLFPYISDTGTKPPESCVFGQLLNLCSFLGCLCVYCWYSHQMDRYETMNSPRWHRIIARFALVLGLLASLGLSVVGNFQETAVLVVHLIGAFMIFTLGTIYVIVLCHISRRHLETPRWLCGFRIFLSFVSVFAFVSMIVFTGFIEPSKRLPPHNWKPEEKGYVFHALSCSCEWLLAVSFLLFFTTMVYELRDYCLDPVKVRYRYADLTRDAIEVPT